MGSQLSLHEGDIDATPLQLCTTPRCGAATGASAPPQSFSRAQTPRPGWASPGVSFAEDPLDGDGLDRDCDPYWPDEEEIMMSEDTTIATRCHASGLWNLRTHARTFSCKFASTQCVTHQEPRL